ncbi:MAG: JAB domain-containing protein [Eubacteriales bacterium]|jgi:DNA repair protein RadC
MTKSIHSGHRQRLKKRFLREGLDAFDPIQQVELLLFFGLPQGDTNPVAHRLLDRFGTIDRILDAPYDELIKVPGVGPNCATMIKYLVAFYRAALTAREQNARFLATPEHYIPYLLPLFHGREVEMVYVFYLDNRGKLLGEERLCTGSQCSVHIPVRQLVEGCMRHAATQVVLAHNHPTGFATPSVEDVSFTRQLRATLLQLEIRLRDHIVVAHDDCVSMLASGYL